MVTVRLAALTANKIANNLKTATNEPISVDDYIADMTVDIFTVINGRELNDAERNELNAIFHF